MDRNGTRVLPRSVMWVALRKESVDRNLRLVYVLKGPVVALRKESVDRNRALQNLHTGVSSRSPQGERG